MVTRDPPLRATRRARGAPLMGSLAALLLATACAPTHHDLAALSAATAPHAWELRPRAVGPTLPEPPGDLRVECRARRERLAAELGGPCAVWIESAPPDDHGQFFQSDDFYYLTGAEAGGIALLLVVDAAGRLVDETLFLPAHDPEWERWNGPRLSPSAEAEAATGVRGTAALDGVDARLAALDVPVVHTLGGQARLPDTLEVTGGGRGPLRAALDRLRLVKSAYEIQCLRNAIAITTTALRDAAAEVGEGVPEYALQGAIEGAYLRHGSERRGFPSICAAGPNAVTLHYSANRDRMDAGELVLMDVGAKYRYYCADVTRTLPVSGRFTPRQREVYEIVLAAQKHAESLARPGMTLRDLHLEAVDFLEQAGYAEHFTHGLGHWIGLDVHDVGRGAAIEVGSLFTIEPGVYLADEGLGIRIEDDYLMTAEGPVRLSTGFPREIDEIEALMEALP